MTEKLNILHVLTTRAPRYGGPPRMAELCTALGQLGHHVELVSTNDDGPERLDVPLGVGIAEDRFVATTFPVIPPRRYTFSPAFVRWLWRNVDRFDVVHTHSIYRFTTVAAARISRLKGVPYIVHPHGALTTYIRMRHGGRKVAYEWLIERTNARDAATVLWESEREQAEAIEAGWPKGTVVWSGVWVPELPATAERREGEVVFLGRLAEKKGVELLIDAFPHVLAQRRDAYLRIIGPDDDGRRPALESRAAALGIIDHVRFEGVLLGEQKDDALKRAALHVMPSADESFGASAVEAMAHATPVVLTAAFPFAEQLSRERGCVLVERDPKQIADAIVGLLNDPVRASETGTNGRAFVAARFSWKTIATELASLYRSLVLT